MNYMDVYKSSPSGDAFVLSLKRMCAFTWILQLDTETKPLSLPFALLHI